MMMTTTTTTTMMMMMDVTVAVTEAQTCPNTLNLRRWEPPNKRNKRVIDQNDAECAANE